jgi:hypothetical protein
MPDKKAVFEFLKVTAVALTHINVRRELHGDEKVPAVDLSLRIDSGNEILDKLDPNLRQALYCNNAATAGQELLPEVLAVLPNLRVPKLNGQKFNWAKGERHKGYRFVLDYGLGDEDSNVELDGCTVTGWAIETKEGGTVILSWTVQYAGEALTDEARGRLTGLTDETIHIQLFAPEVAQISRGKATPSSAPDKEDDEGDGQGPTGDLINGDEDTPEKALIRAHGGDGTQSPEEALADAQR